MEGYKMGITCPSQKGTEVLTREPQVSSELNNLDKRISELSAVLAILEQKLTPILPNEGSPGKSDTKILQSAGSTLVPLAFSISQQADEVHRIIERVDYLNNTIEV
jgi:hypothetical protein